MATLALSVIGGAIGSAALPGGVSLLGASISGAVIGQTIGTIAGAAIDQALFGPLAGASGQASVVEGPRLSDLKVSASTEGTPIARSYGRMRLAGQLIWATRFEEEIITTTETTGGSGGGGGKGLFGGGGGGSSQPQQTVTRIEYRYYANVAYALCEGEIARIGRIWADGKELNQSDYTIRVYRGSEDQQPDSLIEAKEGSGKAPAYRGTAYVVFERMALARFGNRLPQLNFEVFRAVDDFEKLVRAVCVIPAAGEFVYDPTEVLRVEGGTTISENVHTSQGGADWTVSMEQLAEQLPNVESTALFVAWFGNDLRIGECELRPKVEVATKTTQPKSWSVAGVTRSTAQVVSLHDGVPAYGGTPSDASVVAAIQDLKARGLKVTFHPFILMDVAAGNALPDPYTGATGQPAYPWRGRITCDPAPGEPGSPDQTAAAAAQVAAFVGTAAPGDFSIEDESVSYSGPADWSLRRMVLHYAHLCAAAGGVDAFLLGSELRGATWLRASASSYPFVDALVALAADVKAVLGPGARVSYAADWSEYFGHQPADGSGDVYFHLDPLWASGDIDAVAIDVYWPLSDWRDGSAHLDAEAGVPSIYDLDYLRGNIAGGEGYDFFYASQSDREAQARTSITDGAHGKPWVFRFKDVKSWWENQHFDRPGGVETASPSPWVPESKPIWFTELGCPAVDKGANQPNVFVDPKSSESVAPYFSRQVRDDLIQRRTIQAFHEFFDPGHEKYLPGSNPVSSVYGGRMVDLANIHVYCWDARPYPAFPFALDVWADGGNWELGHWLTGRMAGGPLAAVVAAILLDHGFTRFTVAGLTGEMDGYGIDRIMSARAALQPLSLAFFFDAFESGGLIQFAHRGRLGSLATLTPDDLVEASPGSELYTLTRGQESELPASAKITYIDGNADYRQAAVEAKRLAVRSTRVSTADLPIAIDQARAQRIAESWLQDAWAAREQASFMLPPSRLALEPADVVTLISGGRQFPLRLVRTSDAEAKAVEARSIEPHVFQALRTPQRLQRQGAPSVFGPALGVFLELPLLRPDSPAHVGYVTAHASPWPGAVAFYRSPESAGFTLNTLVAAQATLGVTETDFYSGPTGRWDKGNILRVKLDNGTLESVTQAALLGGSNGAAVQNAQGGWEVFQFRDAELVSASVYELGVLLRGQGGTEAAMRDPVPTGARFVLLDSAMAAVDMTPEDIGRDFNWKFGPSNRDIAHQSYATAVHAFAGVGLRPLSPVHVRGRRAPGSDDVTLTWVRRTRLSGDSWEAVEVPLAEESEAYEVDIFDAGTAVRTLSANTTSVVYSEAEQVADFGAPQPAYTVRIHQISPFYGRGTGREAIV